MGVFENVLAISMVMETWKTLIDGDFFFSGRDKERQDISLKEALCWSWLAADVRACGPHI